MTTTIDVRVYYEDTDFSGVVYHANYLRYFERGRTEAMREAGGSHAAMAAADEPLAYTVRDLTAEYRAPARVDELLTVHTTLSELRGARMIFDQEVRRGDDVLCTGRVTVACMTMDGRPRRIPADQRAMFAAVMDGTRGG